MNTAFSDVVCAGVSVAVIFYGTNILLYNNTFSNVACIDTIDLYGESLVDQVILVFNLCNLLSAHFTELEES